VKSISNSEAKKKNGDPTQRTYRVADRRRFRSRDWGVERRGWELGGLGVGSVSPARAVQGRHRRPRERLVWFAGECCDEMVGGLLAVVLLLVACALLPGVVGARD
jgi:hypothetical protein